MRGLVNTTPVVLLMLVGCEYEAPVDGPPVNNVISGTVLFGGEAPPSNAVVTAWNAANPPPPAGTASSPVIADTVGAQQFTGDSAGIQAGEYFFTGLPDGAYIITAILDVDGDFNPFAGVLTGATCGDWLGVHSTDLGSGIPAPVTVAGGEWVEDVTAVFGLELTLERPVFELVNPTLPLGAIVAGQAPPFFRIRTAEVNTAFSPDLPLTLGPACEPSASCTPTSPSCGCEPSSIAPCGTALFVRMTDADLDGIVDPYPSEREASGGLLDIWPRVFMEYVGEDLGTFEYNGRQVRERWLSQGFPMAGEIFGAAGAAGVPPGEAAGNFGPIGSPFPVQELSVTFSPVFRHQYAGGTEGENADGPYDYVSPTPDDPAGVPTGAWSVTLITFTGQTWKIPNEIVKFGLPALDPAVDHAGQGIGLELAP